MRVLHSTESGFGSDIFDVGAIEPSRQASTGERVSRVHSQRSLIGSRLRSRHFSSDRAISTRKPSMIPCSTTPVRTIRSVVRLLTQGIGVVRPLGWNAENSNSSNFATSVPREIGFRPSSSAYGIRHHVISSSLLGVSLSCESFSRSRLLPTMTPPISKASVNPSGTSVGPCARTAPNCSVTFHRLGSTVDEREQHFVVHPCTCVCSLSFSFVSTPLFGSFRREHSAHGRQRTLPDR